MTHTNAAGMYQQAVFVDDTALKAFMNTEDPHYMKARSLFHELDDLDRHLVTTNYIVFDTHQWLKNNYSYSEAHLYLNTIDKAVMQNKLTVISGHSDIERDSKQLLIDCPQYEFSLNEALTAVVMVTYQIKRIFTFNRSFSKLPQLFDEIKVIPSL